MIAADTSSLIAYLQGDEGSDVSIVDAALANKHLILPPIVLTELLSDPRLKSPVQELLVALPLIETLPGYWARAGRLRASVLKKKRKARTADTLIAQSCLDLDVPIIVRDSDFRHFARFAGLKLVP